MERICGISKFLSRQNDTMNKLQQKHKRQSPEYVDLVWLFETMETLMNRITRDSLNRICAVLVGNDNWLLWNRGIGIIGAYGWI